MFDGAPLALSVGALRQPRNDRLCLRVIRSGISDPGYNGLFSDRGLFGDGRLFGERLLSSR
jgi:hypothetical protein